MKALLKKFLSKVLLKKIKKCKDGRKERYFKNKTYFREKESRRERLTEVIKLI